MALWCILHELELSGGAAVAMTHGCLNSLVREVVTDIWEAAHGTARVPYRGVAFCSFGPDVSLPMAPCSGPTSPGTHLSWDLGTGSCPGAAFLPIPEASSLHSY